MGWVYRHSPFTGAMFGVHLAIADSVNDQYGNEFWLTNPRLAKKSRTSTASAKRGLTVLVEGGFLELLEESKGSSASLYRFLFPESPVVYESRGSTGSPRAGSKSGSRVTTKREPAHHERPTGSPASENASHKEVTQENPSRTQGSASSRPQTPERKLAQRIVTDWRDSTFPTPAVSFIGAVKIVERYLLAGQAPNAVARALREAPCTTIPAMDLVLNRSTNGTTGHGSVGDRSLSAVAEWIGECQSINGN